MSLHSSKEMLLNAKQKKYLFENWFKETREYEKWFGNTRKDYLLKAKISLTDDNRLFANGRCYGTIDTNGKERALEELRGLSKK